MNSRVLVMVALCGLTTLGAAESGKDPNTLRPHQPRKGINLVPDASVSAAKGWELLGGAALDETLSHQPDGSGSIRLTKPSESMVFSDYLPVRPGVHYTCSYYLRTTSATQAEKSTVQSGRLNAVANGAGGGGMSALDAAAAAAQAQMNAANGAPATDIKFCAIDDPTCEACQ